MIETKKIKKINLTEKMEDGLESSPRTAMGHDGAESEAWSICLRDDGIFDRNVSKGQYPTPLSIPRVVAEQLKKR